MIEKGFGNREIASALAISYDTARRHSSRVRQKLQLGSAAALPLTGTIVQAATLRKIPLVAQYFTPAEINVLALVCQGMSSKHIARELEITLRTVEKHRQRLLAKSGQRSPRALTAWVAQQYVLSGIAASNA